MADRVGGGSPHVSREQIKTPDVWNLISYARERVAEGVPRDHILTSADDAAEQLSRLHFALSEKQKALDANVAALSAAATARPANGVVSEVISELCAWAEEQEGNPHDEMSTRLYGLAEKLERVSGESQ